MRKWLRLASSTFGSLFSPLLSLSPSLRESIQGPHQSGGKRCESEDLGRGGRPGAPGHSPHLCVPGSLAGAGGDRADPCVRVLSILLALPRFRLTFTLPFLSPSSLVPPASSPRRSAVLAHLCRLDSPFTFLCSSLFPRPAV